MMGGKFPGFQRPEKNWSSLPHQLIEAFPDFTTKGELMVVLYILRHTWGFQEYGVLKKITLDEFEHGRKTKNVDRYPTGRMDNGVGMSKDAILRGLHRAEKHGFIRIEKDDRDKARKKRYYMLRMSGEELTGVMSESQTSDLDVRESDPDVLKSDIGVRKSDSNGTEIKPRSEKETLEGNSKGKKKKKEIELFSKNSQSASPSLFQKGDDFLTVAGKCQAAQNAAGGATTIPSQAGGAFALGDQLITVACARLGRVEPDGNERQKARRFFEKVLKAKDLQQSDGTLAAEAIKKWLDPSGEYAFFQPQYSLEVGNKLAMRHLSIMLAKVMQQARDRAARDAELLEEYEGDYEEPERLVIPEPKPMTEAERIWQAALGEIQLQMTKATFNTWVKNTRAISHEDGVFVIEAANALTRDWLENRLLTTVKRTLVGIVGHPVEVEFCVEYE